MSYISPKGNQQKKGCSREKRAQTQNQKAKEGVKETMRATAKILTIAAILTTSALWAQVNSKPLVVFDYGGGDFIEVSLHLNGAPLTKILAHPPTGSPTQISSIGFELYLDNEKSGGLLTTDGSCPYTFHNAGVAKPGGMSYIVGNKGVTLQNNPITIDFTKLSCRVAPFLILQGSEKCYFINTTAVDFVLNGVAMKWSQEFPNSPLLQTIKTTATTQALATPANMTTSSMTTLNNLNPPYVLFEYSTNKVRATVNLDNLQWSEIPGINLDHLAKVVVSGRNIAFKCLPQDGVFKSSAWTHPDDEAYSLWLYDTSGQYHYVKKKLVPAIGENVKIRIMDTDGQGERWYLTPK